MPTYGIAIFPQEPAEFRALCERVEAGPFDHLWVPDERFYRDVGVGLTLAALATKRVRIGPAVTDPFVRHPALTASMMATLDELSGGRLVVGIGAGVSGFKSLGVKQEKPTLAIREMVALMRSLWTGGHVDFAGTTMAFRDGALDWRPPRADIPIWIAGRGPQVLALGGEVAEGVMVGALCSAPTLRYAFGQIERGHARRAPGLPPLSRAVWLHTAVSEDGGLARTAVRTIVAGALVSSLAVLPELGVELPAALLARLRGVTYGTHNPEMIEVADTLDDDVLRHFSVAGTPAEVRARLVELAALGIDHFAVVPWLAQGQTIAQFIDALARAIPA